MPQKSDAVTASEFARHFGQYRVKAQRAPIAISSHGEVTGYFIAADDYHALMKARATLEKSAVPATNRIVGRAADIDQSIIDQLISNDTSHLDD